MTSGHKGFSCLSSRVHFNYLIARLLFARRMTSAVVTARSVAHTQKEQGFSIVKVKLRLSTWI